MVGQTLSHYRILQKIGQGGMGEVFLAQDTSLDRRVAIKVLTHHTESDETAHRRFLREARLAGSLDHPYICSVHEFLETDNGTCIVMEFVEGETVRERLARGPLPLADSLRLAQEIAEALEKAHQKGIIHRDLKPGNIMITAEGHVKVTDFGLAKQVAAIETAGQEMTRSSLTEAGMLAGTLEYMSPEQIQGGWLTPQSDIFAFGIVLCEMVAGVHPFRRPRSLDTALAIAHEQPSSLALPDEIRRLIDALLSKQPHERGSAHDARICLARLAQQVAAEASPVAPELRSLRRTFSRRSVALPILAVLIVLFAGAYRQIDQRRKAAWARDVALPEIARLAETGNALAAFNLAARAEPYLAGRTSALDELRPLFSRSAAVQSDPAGANVWWKEHRAADGEWKLLGETPIKDARIPAVFATVRIEKQGYRPIIVGSRFTEGLSLPLDPIGALPDDMVRVPASVFRLPLPGLDHLKQEALDAFLIDKYEVTNRAYRRFMDDGGYRERKYWTQRFVGDDGRTMSWGDAIDRFRDRTGRAGPATWEAGDYPAGQDDYPVSGVSWYEAAAYAEYAGKRLPTLYHWYTAAGMASSADIVPLSNIGLRPGPARVGAFRGLGPFGTFDMAGNVREWCRNSSDRGQKFILGGGWNDPLYAFDSDSYTQPPFDRSPSNGFRCIKPLDNSENAAVSRVIGLSFRDFFKEKPSSSEAFNVFLRQYAYDPAPLHAETSARDTTSTAWVREKVLFDAAYGNERVPLYLYLPTNVRPPYQVVLHWPGDNGLHLRSSDSDLQTGMFDFIVKSGRAVAVPVLRSMYERSDGLESTVPNESNGYREHVIAWVKDIRRTVDYLQTRTDIDASKLAFYGHSWGGRMSSVPLAVDNRFKAAVLCVAGFRFPRSLPEADPFNFVSHVQVPVLMLNGRYDHYFPVETAQKPMFVLLGTRPENKKWIVYDGGHFVPRDQLIKETLSWLDRHLGKSR